MKFDLWPIVGREQLVQAFRPGSAAKKEAPFRTLRARGWATAGVNVVTRSAQRASGRVTIFSVLNVIAARRAREGDTTKAASLARAASRIERSRGFKVIARLLSGRTAEDVAAAIDGQLAQLDALHAALVQVARETDAMHELGAPDVVTGTVTKISDDAVLLQAAGGVQTWLPRWLARGVHREEVGDALALVTERLDAHQLVVRAVPALEVKAASRSSPFGRDARVHTLSAADVKKLAGRPAPLKVVVPVTIGK